MGSLCYVPSQGPACGRFKHLRLVIMSYEIENGRRGVEYSVIYNVFVNVYQVLKPSILKEGFEKIRKDAVEVTDDVSIAEYIGCPVSSCNILPLLLLLLLLLLLPR